MYAILDQSYRVVGRATVQSTGQEPILDDATWLAINNGDIATYDPVAGTYSLSLAAPPPVEPLADAKVRLCDEIDADAEAARLRYITAGAGQVATYLQKATEADAYKAAGYPASTTAYPLLAAEATALGQSAQQVAGVVIAQRDAWVGIAASIEGIRRGATDITAGSIHAAADTPAAEAARDTAKAALAAI